MSWDESRSWEDETSIENLLLMDKIKRQELLFQALRSKLPLRIILFVVNYLLFIDIC